MPSFVFPTEVDDLPSKSATPHPRRLFCCPLVQNRFHHKTTLLRLGNPYIPHVDHVILDETHVFLFGNFKTFFHEPPPVHFIFHVCYSPTKIDQLPTRNPREISKKRSLLDVYLLSSFHNFLQLSVVA